MNASISLNGLEIESSNQTTINQTPDWFNWFNGDRTYVSIIGLGEANTSLDSLELISEFEAITSNGTASISLDQIEVSTEFQSIQSYGDSLVLVDGIELQSEHGVITATGTQSISATIALQSILLSSEIGQITAKSERKIPGGSVHIRPISVKDARAVLKPVMSVAFAGRINAYGLIVNNAIASFDPVIMDSEISKISANGVLDIEDDDLLLLLAA